MASNGPRAQADAVNERTPSGSNSAGGCLLPKSERLSAVGSRVAVPPNRLSYTLRVLITRHGLGRDAGIQSVRETPGHR
jgi:hypothetical protein